MESKAKKAALAYVEREIRALIKDVSYTSPSNKTAYLCSLGEIESRLEYIKKWIKEYDLEDKILLNAIEQIYAALMKVGRFDAAASFAKKHGL